MLRYSLADGKLRQVLNPGSFPKLLCATRPAQPADTMEA
jgi:hypothetical protein